MSNDIKEYFNSAVGAFLINKVINFTLKLKARERLFLQFILFIINVFLNLCCNEGRQGESFPDLLNTSKP